MKIYYDLQQGTDEWLEVRLGKFGGTDAHTVSVNGKGLETLCMQKASELLVKRPPDAYINSDMERGVQFEDTARIIYEMQTGKKVDQVGYIEHSEWVGVSPDGLVCDDSGVEIKCPSDYKFVKFLYEKKQKGIKAIENAHYYQMQHAMYVTGRKQWDYVIFNDNINEINITTVDRDDEAIEKIVTGLEHGVKRVEEIMQEIMQYKKNRSDV